MEKGTRARREKGKTNQYNMRPATSIIGIQATVSPLQASAQPTVRVRF